MEDSLDGRLLKLNKSLRCRSKNDRARSQSLSSEQGALLSWVQQVLGDLDEDEDEDEEGDKREKEDGKGDKEKDKGKEDEGEGEGETREGDKGLQGAGGHGSGSGSGGGSEGHRSLTHSEQAVSDAEQRVRRHLPLLAVDATGNARVVEMRDMKEDILRILVLSIHSMSSRGPGLDKKLEDFSAVAAEYLVAALVSCPKRSLKALVYMTLSAVRCRLPESIDNKFYDVALQDIDTCNMHTLRWISNTTVVMPEIFVGRVVSSLQNILFRSVASISLLEKAATGLLNLSRNHGADLTLETELSRISTLLQRDSNSCALVCSLLALACELCVSDPHPAISVPLASSVAFCLEKAFLDWSVATTRDQRFHSVRTAEVCLKFFRMYQFSVDLSTTAGHAKYAVPRWWLTVSAVMSSILKKDIAFELDQVQRESTILDEQRVWHRSASLLASLQMSVIDTLVSIYKFQLNSSPCHPNILNFDCIENGIIFGALVPSITCCLTQMLRYGDEHIKFAGVKALRQFASLTIPLDNNSLRSLRSSEAKSRFCDTITVQLDGSILVLFDILKHDGIVFFDLQTLSLVLDTMVIFSNNALAAQIQVYLVQILKDWEEDEMQESVKITHGKKGYNEMRQDEYVRALLCFNDRNYVQSLQMIASVAPRSYNDIVNSCQGNTSFLHRTPLHHSDLSHVVIKQEQRTPSDDGRNLEEVDESFPNSSCHVPQMWTAWQRHIPSNFVGTPGIKSFPCLYHFSTEQLNSFQHVEPNVAAVVPAPDTSSVMKSSQGLSLRSIQSFSSEDNSSSAPLQTIPINEECRAKHSSSSINLSRSRSVSDDSKQQQPLQRKSSKFSLTKMMSFSSSNESQQSESIVKVSKESVSLTVCETFSGLCFRDGSLNEESIDVDGRVFMECKVNKTVCVEVGMNLDHPNVFSGVTRRLREAEIVHAYDVTFDKDSVSKVDPRGSILVKAKPSQRDQIHAKKEIMHYKVKCRYCPLKVISTCSLVKEDGGTGSGTLIIRQEFTNSSEVIDLSDMRVEIELPGNDGISSCDLIGDNQMKFSLNSDNQGGVCVYPKVLKHKRTIVFHLKVKMSGVNVNRYSSLDDQLKRTISGDNQTDQAFTLQNAKVSFKVLTPRKNNSPNVSTLTGFNVRYINVLDKTSKISKHVKFDIALKSFEACFSSKDFEVGSLSHDDEEKDHKHVATSGLVETSHFAKDQINPGTGKLVVRPWSWTDDALILEELYDEAALEMGTLLLRSGRDHTSEIIAPNTNGSDMDFATRGMLYTDESKNDTFDNGDIDEDNADDIS